MEGLIEPQDVLDLLARLVEQSLALAEVQGGETRYRLLESVRQYAEGLARLTAALAHAGEAARAAGDWRLQAEATRVTGRCVPAGAAGGGAAR